MSHLPLTLLKSKSFRSCMAAAAAATAATGDWGTTPRSAAPFVGFGGAWILEAALLAALFGMLLLLLLLLLAPEPAPFSVREVDTLIRGVSERVAFDPISDWETLIAGWCGWR